MSAMHILYTAGGCVALAVAWVLNHVLNHYADRIKERHKTTADSHLEWAAARARGRFRWVAILLGPAPVPTTAPPPAPSPATAPGRPVVPSHDEAVGTEAPVQPPARGPLPFSGVPAPFSDYRKPEPDDVLGPIRWRWRWVKDARGWTAADLTPYCPRPGCDYELAVCPERAHHGRRFTSYRCENPACLNEVLLAGDAHQILGLTTHHIERNARNGLRGGDPYGA